MLASVGFDLVYVELTRRDEEQALAVFGNADCQATPDCFPQSCLTFGSATSWWRAAKHRSVARCRRAVRQPRSAPHSGTRIDPNRSASVLWEHMSFIGDIHDARVRRHADELGLAYGTLLPAMGLDRSAKKPCRFLQWIRAKQIEIRVSLRWSAGDGGPYGRIGQMGEIRRIVAPDGGLANRDRLLRSVQAPGGTGPARPTVRRVFRYEIFVQSTRVGFASRALDPNATALPSGEATENIGDLLRLVLRRPMHPPDSHACWMGRPPHRRDRQAVPTWPRERRRCRPSHMHPPRAGNNAESAQSTNAIVKTDLGALI